ncbi:MAG: carboxypeptidase regulatory-like domain-containing protein, partial [Acidobacteriaceae bacterium]|nr:carboxypeptidase regulatory-like domain-containing protein [Acidobacteriaceae bacterium]
MSRYLALCTCLFLPAIAAAQSVSGSITGSVSDISGAPVSGAAVKLASEATTSARTASTDERGSFTFSAVNPGVYSVTVDHPGFKTFQKTHMELTPGDNLAVGNLKLEVGSQKTLVEVTAQGSNVQTANGERSGIITSQEIQQLTVLNRDFTQFAELQPGVVANAGADVQSFTGNTTLNVLGGRTTNNNIAIDGITALNSNGGNTNTTVSLDAVQTVDVKVSNFDAEYGRNSGATVLAVTKSGTQQFHGALYYYDRNEAFNANNFFNNLKGLPRQEYRVNYAGGYLGGPVMIPRLFNTSRKKLFFFFDAEVIGEKRPKPEQDVTVPTALERQGNFTQSGKTVKDPSTGKALPGNIMQPSQIAPSMQKYLNLLPLPNFSNTAISKGAYNYVYEESLSVPKHLDIARVDYNIADNTLMFAKFNYWWEDQQGAAVSAGNSSWGWLPDHYTAQTPSANLSVTHIFSPTTVLEANLGFQRFTENGPPLSHAEVAAKSRTATGVDIPQFNPSINPYNLVPAATFGSGVSNPANPTYASRFPLRGVENTYNTDEGITKVSGQHTFKAGFYAEYWAAMKGLNASNFAGTMNFASDSNNPQDTGYPYSNALFGILTSYTETTTRPAMYEFNTGLDWYAQDTWKISRSFSLDYGLRFGWSTPWHSNQNQEAGFLPSLWNPQQRVQLIQPILVNGKRMGFDPITRQVVAVTDVGAIAPEAGNPYNGIVNRLTDPSYPRGLRYTDGIKTMPRLSFAWDPVGDGKTVIRGGGGFFYDTHERDNFSNGIEYTEPIQANPAIEYTTVQSFINSKGLLFPGTIQGIDPQRHVQLTMNFSFGIQREIGFGTVLDVAYVGALGRHLIAREDVNATQLGTDFQPQNQDPTNGKPLPSSFVRPYTGYGGIDYYCYCVSSSYHSLQTQLRRRYKNNLTYGLVWTWSKAMDYADSDSSTGADVSSVVSQKIWNYAEAGYDHTHIVRIYWTYNLPRASSVLN